MSQQERNPTTRSRQVSRILGSLAIGAAALTGAAESMMLFSDLGPGETQASRNSLELSVLFVGGIVAVIFVALWGLARLWER